MDRPAKPRQARWPRWREAVDRIVEDKAEVRNRFLCRNVQGQGAHADNRTWTASSWTGALVMSNRFTSSGNLFCPASSQTAALSGSP